MPTLSIVIASTREGRVGEPVARWCLARAQAHGRMDARLVDLKDVNLPLLSEPNHPRLRTYQQASTLAWSALVDASDAFVFVTPEYNHSLPPALANALDHLYQEWNYKACAFVSYGGVSAGTRSVVAAKQLVASLKMVPLVESVPIPFVNQLIQDGAFAGTDALDKAAAGMFDELLRWTEALRVLRPR